VLDLVLATLRGEVKPVMSVYDCRQIQSYPTTIQPMRGLVDRIKAMEGKDGILSVSIAHCFPYGDVAEIGTRVLVIADGDKKKADALAIRLGEELVALRGKTQPPSLDVAAGVKEAVAFNDLPVVIADPADNAGGGAPSDNTDIVRHLIDSKVENACLGPIWDRIAVRLCFDAGLGGSRAALRRQDRSQLGAAGRCRGRDRRLEA
jgi:microcystin degradation protein MlrC